MIRQLISPEYAALNRQLHQEREDYGATDSNGPQVVEFCKRSGFRTVLDYGCGKGGLKRSIEQLDPSLTVFEFDPAIAGKTELPADPVDLIVALDVMEHIEPEYLDAVLETMRALRPKCVVMKIALTPAEKSLPDGRNAHILLRTPEWWESELGKHFVAISGQVVGAGLYYAFVGRPL